MSSYGKKEDKKKREMVGWLHFWNDKSDGGWEDSGVGPNQEEV